MVPRFGLSRLLALIAVIALFAAALRQSSELWKQLTTTFTVLVFTVALIHSLTASGTKRLFWTAFFLGGVVHWGAATSGINWLCVHPGDLVTQYWILPARGIMHPSPGRDAQGMLEFVQEWRFFSQIATQFNSLFVAAIAAYFARCNTRATTKPTTRNRHRLSRKPNRPTTSAQACCRKNSRQSDRRVLGIPN